MKRGVGSRLHSAEMYFPRWNGLRRSNGLLFPRWDGLLHLNGLYFPRWKRRFDLQAPSQRGLNGLSQPFGVLFPRWKTPIE